MEFHRILWNSGCIILFWWKLQGIRLLSLAYYPPERLLQPGGLAVDSNEALSSGKFALCTPKQQKNKPWDKLMELYTKALKRSSFKWYEVVYYRMLAMDKGESKFAVAEEFYEMGGACISPIIRPREV